MSTRRRWLRKVKKSSAELTKDGTRQSLITTFFDLRLEYYNSSQLPAFSLEEGTHSQPTGRDVVITLIISLRFVFMTVAPSDDVLDDDDDDEDSSSNSSCNKSAMRKKKRADDKAKKKAKMKAVEKKRRRSMQGLY
jgi:hypothetical protein